MHDRGGKIKGPIGKGSLLAPGLYSMYHVCFEPAANHETKLSVLAGP